MTAYQTNGVYETARMWMEIADTTMNLVAQMQDDGVIPADRELEIPAFMITCGNCSNVLSVTPDRLQDQILDGQEATKCSCGAPTFRGGDLVRLDGWL
jgi:hypothetical protein